MTITLSLQDQLDYLSLLGDPKNKEQFHANIDREIIATRMFASTLPQAQRKVDILREIKRDDTLLVINETRSRINSVI